MSRSIDLFIDCDRPIEEVAAELARLTGLTLAPGSLPGTWAMEEGGVHADLRAHPYVDDGDLPFESYRYALSTRVGNDVRPHDSAEATMLRLIGEALHQGGVPALLVHDLQYRDRSAAAPVDVATAGDAAGGGGPAGDPAGGDGSAGDPAGGDGSAGDGSAGEDPTAGDGEGRR